MNFALERGNITAKNAFALQQLARAQYGQGFLRMEPVCSLFGWQVTNVSLIHGQARLVLQRAALLRYLKESETLSPAKDCLG